MNYLKPSAKAILAVFFLVLAGCSALGPEPILEEGAPFGAISYSESTQRWQVVSDLPSRSVAQSQALSGCQEKDCKVLLVFARGECASMSLDAAKVAQEPYVSVMMDADSAINSARNACSSAGGKDCKATPPVCN